MELSLIGLQNAGKSSLVNVLTTGSFHEDMIPTVSSNRGQQPRSQLLRAPCRRGGCTSHADGDTPQPRPMLTHACLPPVLLCHVCLSMQVGFNMRKVTKGGVTIKMWDLGGQVCVSRHNGGGGGRGRSWCEIAASDAAACGGHLIVQFGGFVWQPGSRHMQLAAIAWLHLVSAAQAQ